MRQDVRDILACACVSGLHGKTMPFLCLRKMVKSSGKNKDQFTSKCALSLPGRLTGSDSVDTLAKLSLVKQTGLRSFRAERVIIQDFVPCVDDELSVTKGEKVTVLYRDHDWVYATRDDGREGFVPLSFCAKPGHVMQTRPATKPTKKATSHELLSSQFINKDIPPGQLGGDVTVAQSSGEHGGYGEVTLFSKCDSGQYVALFDFLPRQENDLAVKRGEIVTLLNYADPEWFWVLRGDTVEGFIPATYACPLDRNTHELILIEQASDSAAIAAEKANVHDTSGHVFYTGNRPDMRNASYTAYEATSASYIGRTVNFMTASTDFQKRLKLEDVSAYKLSDLRYRQPQTHERTALDTAMATDHGLSSITSRCATTCSRPRSTAI